MQGLSLTPNSPSLPPQVGPFVGATLAALAYKVLFSTNKPSKPNDNNGFSIAAYFEPKSYINA